MFFAQPDLFFKNSLFFSHRIAHKQKEKQCGTKDLRACWQLRPRPAPGLLTPGSPLPPRSSLVCFCAALNVFKSRAHLRNSTGSVGVGPTTALLPAPALPEIIARPSDARPAIVASRFTGVLLCCALCLHTSCTRAEPYGVRRCSKNDRCSRAPRQLQLRALDLLSSPC